MSFFTVMLALMAIGALYLLIHLPRQVIQRRDNLIKPFEDFTNAQVEAAARYAIGFTLGTDPGYGVIYGPGRSNMTELTAALIYLHRKRLGENPGDLKINWTNSLTALSKLSPKPSGSSRRNLEQIILKTDKIADTHHDPDGAIRNAVLGAFYSSMPVPSAAVSTR